MKIYYSTHPKQGGFAVVVVLIFLFLMVAFAAANTSRMNWLAHQVSSVEEKQLHRWSAQ